MYNTRAESRCVGCKSVNRMVVGCPFITCAVKKKDIEFCWQCKESSTCDKWKKHREAGKQHDSFKCYQKLETDISFIHKHGVEEYIAQQKIRECYLREMLMEFNDGRSKSYYCIAATVLSPLELQDAVKRAREETQDMQPKQKAKALHAILDQVSKEKGYLLKLRK